jgi:hypothetical protein
MSLSEQPTKSLLPETFDLWSLDQGRALGVFPSLAAALAATRALCLKDLPELVLSRDDGVNRRAIAVGVEVLNLAAVPGGPWSEARFASVRRAYAIEAVRAASTDWNLLGDDASRRQLDAASRRLLRLGPPDQTNG